MANSYTEVTLTQAQTTGFTTPSYVESSHLVVKVNDVVVPSTSVGATNKVFGSFTATNALYYIIIEGQTSLSFSEELPSGVKVHIQRSSNQNSRLVDYSDASLLTADTMDRDANQIFFVAQEALDQSSLTNVAASDFYYSQGTEPATNTVGTLWYDTSSTPNVLKIRSSTGFELAAPIMTQATLDGSALAAGTGTYSGYDVIPVGSDFNNKSALYLNGIKQVAGTSLGDNDYFQVGTNVYIPTVANTDVIQVISNAQNLDDVVTRSGTQTITGAKDFTGAVSTNDLTVDLGTSNTLSAIKSSTGFAQLSVKSTATGGSTDFGIIEVSGTDGAYIDIAKPDGTGYDLRIQHIDENNSVVVADTSNLIMQVQDTNRAVILKHGANSPKLTTTTTGIEVTGVIKGDSLDIDGNATFTSSDTSDQVIIENTNTSTDSAPDLKFRRSGAVGQASNIGVVAFNALNSTPTDFAYANIVVDAVNLTAGSETGKIKLQVADPSDGLSYPVPRLSVDKDGIDVAGTVTADGINTSDHVAIDNNKRIQLKDASGNTATEIYTDTGNNTWIAEAGSGALNIKGESFYIKNADNQPLVTSGGESVQLAHCPDANTSNQRLETTPSGVTVTGTVTADALTMGDSEKITLGTGGDLEIYHNGSNSVIEEKGTGNLFIKGTDLVLEDTSGNKFFKGVAGGAVQIWHNAASHATAKLATTATGIDVNGTVTSDGLRLGNNESLQTLKTDGSTALTIYTDATHNHTYIDEAGSGNLVIDANDFVVRDKDSGGQNRRIVSTQGSSGYEISAIMILMLS